MMVGSRGHSEHMKAGEREPGPERVRNNVYWGASCRGDRVSMCSEYDSPTTFHGRTWLPSSHPREREYVVLRMSHCGEHKRETLLPSREKEPWLALVRDYMTGNRTKAGRHLITHPQPSP